MTFGFIYLGGDTEKSISEETFGEGDFLILVLGNTSITIQYHTMLPGLEADFRYVHKAFH